MRIFNVHIKGIEKKRSKIWETSKYRKEFFTLKGCGKVSLSMEGKHKYVRINGDDDVQKTFQSNELSVSAFL